MLKIEELASASVSLDPEISNMILWSVPTVGFGTFHFYNGVDDKVHCGNEYMSKEFIKKVLCDMIDNCVLDEIDK